MTTSIVAGIEVDFDRLPDYAWFNDKITLGGQEYRLLHGYMAAYLVEISSVNTVATTAAASAGAARDQVLAVQAAIVAANELTVQTTAGHVQDAEAARDAAEQAAIDAEADRVAAEAAAASIAGGPVASVNGRTGIVTGLLEADLSNIATTGARQLRRIALRHALAL